MKKYVVNEILVDPDESSLYPTVYVDVTEEKPSGNVGETFRVVLYCGFLRGLKKQLDALQIKK